MVRTMHQRRNQQQRRKLGHTVRFGRKVWDVQKQGIFSRVRKFFRGRA